MKKSTLIILLVTITMLLTSVPVFAEGPYGEGDAATSDVTIEVYTNELNPGAHEDEDVIAFEITWEDTSISINNYKHYHLIWNPETLMWERSYDDSTYSLHDEDKTISAKITNLSSTDLNFEMSFTAETAVSKYFSATTVTEEAPAVSGATETTAGTPTAVEVSMELSFASLGLANDDAALALINNGQSIGSVTIKIQ